MNIYKIKVGSQIHHMGVVYLKAIKIIRDKRLGALYDQIVFEVYEKNQDSGKIEKSDEDTSIFVYYRGFLRELDWELVE